MDRMDRLLRVAVNAREIKKCESTTVEEFKSGAPGEER